VRIKQRRRRLAPTTGHPGVDRSLRARDPDFYLFPQNASELASHVPAYLNMLNGIGQEDICFGMTFNLS
jgi:hypothetical protein